MGHILKWYIITLSKMSSLMRSFYSRQYFLVNILTSNAPQFTIKNLVFLLDKNTLRMHSMIISILDIIILILNKSDPSGSEQTPIHFITALIPSSPPNFVLLPNISNWLMVGTEQIFLDDLLLSHSVDIIGINTHTWVNPVSA